MSHPIVEDTNLQCDKGTLQTPIKVTSQDGIHIGSMLQATEKDKAANSNIIPFGQCRLKPTSGGYLPCTPALIQWQKTSPFTINGMKELTTDSFCMCSTGGKVTPLTPAVSNFEHIEEAPDDILSSDRVSSEGNESSQVVEIFWSYGEECKRLKNKSRFYSDMNLHILTKNCEKGETIEIVLKNEDGSPIVGEVLELKLSGITNANNEIILKNVFEKYTLNLFQEE